MTRSPAVPAALVSALALLGCAAPTPPTPIAPVPEWLQAAPVAPQPPSAAPVAPRPSAAPPAASPSPSPSPSPGKLDPDWKQGEAFPFNARPRPDVPGHDLFIYNERMDTVLALTGANTPFDDIQPVMSNDKQWVVYEQIRPSGHGGTNSDVLLYNTVTQRREPLVGVNTVAFNETAPTLDGEGKQVAYVTDEGGEAQLRIYDIARHQVFEVPATGHLFRRVANPAFSGNGKLLAFSAEGGATDGFDVYLVDLARGVVWAPPYVNTAFDEDTPALNSNGTRLLFVSNRFGTFDVAEANLDTGLIDDLAFANTPDFDETLPGYLGEGERRILYRIVHPGGDPETFLFRIYDRQEARVDTLPITNDLLLPPFLAESP